MEEYVLVIAQNKFIVTSVCVETVRAKFNRRIIWGKKYVQHQRSEQEMRNGDLHSIRKCEDIVGKLRISAGEEGKSEGAKIGSRKMHRVRLIPVKTGYVIEPPFPEPTVNELLDLDRTPAEFRTVDVTEHYGSVGIINSRWLEKKVDWYVNAIEFVCIRKLERGQQSVAGPFRLVRKQGQFIILEASDSTVFSHPTFLKKTNSERTEFTSTLAWMWSRECLCQENESALEDLECECPCQATFSWGFCLRCPDVHKRLSEEQQK
ncbi:hypothetical protein R1sor_013074 [Riccia sorocarpa]|uniref:Uncharacterized protein n=1 Tax=Riccia sorocarpa TaxID=122646 RepID=A0ABD3H922_9MARC